MIGVIAAVLLSGACGAATETTTPGLSRAEAEDLQRRFGACDGPYDGVGDFVDYLATEVAEWRELDASNRPAVTTLGKDTDFAGVTVALKPVGSDDATARELTLHLVSSTKDGILWAFDNGARVYLGLAAPGTKRLENTTVMTLIVSREGWVVFPGICGSKTAESLARHLGPEYHRRTSTLPGKTGDDVRTWLEPERAAPGPSTSPPAGREGTSGAGTLRSVSLQLDYPSSWVGPYTLCTKHALGWNDCIPLGAAADPRRVVPSRVDTDGRLQVWLLDEQARLDRPLELLGTVVLDATTSGEAVVLRITGSLDTARGTVRDVAVVAERRPSTVTR